MMCRIDFILHVGKMKGRAVARALIGGGVYIHIFMYSRLISFEISPNDN